MRNFPIIAAVLAALILVVAITFPFEDSFENKIRYVAVSDQTPSALIAEADLKRRITVLPAPALELAELAAMVLEEAQRTQSESRFREAERLANQSLKLLRRENPARLVLAKLAEARHDFRLARSLAMQSLYQGGGISALMVLTTASLAQGDLRMAARYANQAVEEEAATVTYVNRALVNAAAGRFREAEFDFERALRLESATSRPEAARMRFLWGRHLLRKGETEKAKLLVEQGLRAMPDNRLGLQVMAECHTAARAWSEARKSLLASMAQGPMPRDLILMAQLFKAQGSADEFRAYRKQAEEWLRKELKQGRYGHRLELVQALLLDDKTAESDEVLSLLKEEVHVRQTAELYALWAQAHAVRREWKPAHMMALEAVSAGGAYASYFRALKEIETELGDGPRAKLYSAMMSVR